jgi:hypothetical protein
MQRKACAGLAWAAMALSVPQAAMAAGCPSLVPVLNDLCEEKSHADALVASLQDEEQRAYDNLKRVSDDLQRLTDEANTANSQLSELLAALDNAQSVVNGYAAQRAALEQVKTDTASALEPVTRQLDDVASKTNELRASVTRRIDAVTGRQALIDRVADAVAKALKQIGVDAGAYLGRLNLMMKMTTNPIAATSWTAFRLPDGSWIDSAKLQALSRGEIATPDVDLVQLVVKDLPFRIDRISGWREWRDHEVGSAKHIFASSERFTDWFGTERAAKELVAALASGGATAGGTLDEARQQITLEWTDLVAWLKVIGRQEAMAIASELLGNIIRNQRATVEQREASFALTPIQYDVRLSFQEERLGPAGKLVFGALPKDMRLTAHYEENHIGYALRLSGPNVGMTPRQLADGMLARLQSGFDPLAEVQVAAKSAGLDPNTIAWISAADRQSELGNAWGARVKQLLLGQDPRVFAKEIVARTKNGYEVDLLGSIVDRRIRNALKETGIGDAQFSRLSIDLKSGRLSGEGDIDVKISVTSIADLLKRFNVWRGQQDEALSQEKTILARLFDPGASTQPPGPAAPYVESWEALVKRRGELDAEETTLRAKVADTEKSIGTLADSLSAASTLIDGADGRQLALHNTLAARTADLAAVQARFHQLTDQIHDLYHRIDEARNAAAAVAIKIADFAVPAASPDPSGAKNVLNTIQDAVKNKVQNIIKSFPGVP